MRIVELFGPPGVGKSTLTRAVAFRPCGLPASGTAPRGAYRAAYDVLRTHMTERLQTRMGFTGRLLSGLEQILARRGTASWLIEEGCAQRVNLLACIAVPLETQQAYVEALPVEQLTVCLCVADAETIIRRGQQRGRPGLPPEHGPIALEACVRTAESLAARGATVYRFDMLQPIAANAVRLRDVLAT